MALGSYVCNKRAVVLLVYRRKVVVVTWLVFVAAWLELQTGATEALRVLAWPTCNRLMPTCRADGCNVNARDLSLVRRIQ